MKKHLVSLFLILGSLNAAAFEPLLNESTKEVLYILKPVLIVSFVEYEKDNGFLTLSYEYDGRSHIAQVDELEAKYPGYRPRIIDASAAGEFTLRSTDLNWSTSFRPSNGQAGPFFTHYEMLDKEQLQKLRTAVSNGTMKDLFKLTAPVVIEYSADEVIDQIAVPGSTCATLLQPQSDLSSFLKNLLNYHPPKSPTNANAELALKNELSKKCFEVDTSLAVTSFHELVTTKLKINSVERIVGATTRTTHKQETINQDYSVVLGGK